MTERQTGGSRVRKSWNTLKRLAKGSPGPFDYKLLPLDGPHETRYVQLFAGHEDSDIEIDMVVADVKQKYAFAALSYVWGSRADPLPVYMGSYPRYVFNVTRSLHAALRHVRRSIAKGKSIFIWIDALCINQQDSDEKAQQIPLMPLIYPRATSTYCWLGEAIESTALTFDFFRRSHTAYFEKDHDTSKALFQRLVDESSRQEQPLMTGINVLLQHPWFQRAWILQEACRSLEDTPMLIQGDCSMQLLALLPVMVFMQAPYVDGGPDKSFYDKACIPAFTCTAIATTPREELTFTKLLVAMTPRKAEVPRDKLFALLGLVHNPEAYPAPDYKMGEEDVCRLFTRSILQQEQSLQLLTLMKPELTQRSSWCLDLERLLTERARPARKLEDGSEIPDYTATRSSTPVFTRIKPNPHTTMDAVLGLQGHILDVVATITVPGFLTGLRDAGRVSWTAIVEELAVTRSLLQLTATYKYTGEPMDLAFARTVTCDCFFSLPTRQRAWQHDHSAQFYSCYKDIRTTDTLLNEDDLLSWAQTNLPLSALGSPQSTGPAALDAIAQLLTEKAAGIWTYAMRQALTNDWMFITTSNGYIGWAPRITMKGDTIALLSGSNIPLVLREVEEQWEYVGTCQYLHGAMFGDAYDETQLRDFQIV